MCGPDKALADFASQTAPKCTLGHKSWIFDFCITWCPGVHALFSTFAGPGRDNIRINFQMSDFAEMSQIKSRNKSWCQTGTSVRVLCHRHSSTCPRVARPDYGSQFRVASAKMSTRKCLELSAPEHFTISQLFHFCSLCHFSQSVTQHFRSLCRAHLRKLPQQS